jgi:hypothetical protein
MQVLFPVNVVRFMIDLMGLCSLVLIVTLAAPSMMLWRKKR